jgi:hypothetical protein
LLGALSVRASNERDATKATQTARAAQFLDPLKALCTGQATSVPGTATFVQGPGIHPLVAFRTLNATNYNQDTRVGTGDWAATSLDQTQLVLCAEERSTIIESCPYKSDGGGTTSYIDRSRSGVSLRLISAQSGQVVATQTLQGGEPRQCADKETFASGINRFTVAGDPVSPATIQAWLKPYVAP